MQTEVDSDRQALEIPKTQLYYRFKGFYFGNLPSELQHLLQIENVPIFTGCFKHVSLRLCTSLYKFNCVN